MTLTSKTFSPFWNSLLHGIAGFVVYGVSLFLMQHQAVAAMTVGSVVTLVLKWVDGKLGN